MGVKISFQLGLSRKLIQPFLICGALISRIEVVAREQYGSYYEDNPKAILSQKIPPEFEIENPRLERGLPRPRKISNILQTHTRHKIPYMHGLNRLGKRLTGRQNRFQYIKPYAENQFIKGWRKADMSPDSLESARKGRGRRQFSYFKLQCCPASDANRDSCYPME